MTKQMLATLFAGLTIVATTAACSSLPSSADIGDNPTGWVDAAQVPSTSDWSYPLISNRQTGWHP
ncbi:MAG TPA: hypothetical protein VM689_24560 [Aliidongia sp.]|nr:hypothetical protein [Aliidongia sp.]